MTANETIPATLDDVLTEFRKSAALLAGHFKLSSGRHSGHYLQCARGLMNPARAGRLAQAIVNAIPQEVIEQIDALSSGKK